MSIRVIRDLLSVTETLALRVPCVIRLAGNRKNEGLDLLRRSSLAVFATDDLVQAAETIVREIRRTL